MKRLGKIKTLAVAALAAVAVAAPIAIAQTTAQDEQAKPHGEHRGGERHGRGGRRGGGFGFRGIELTDDQKTRLGQLHQSFGERTRPLRQQLRAKRQELRQLQEGDTFNEALAAQKLTESAAIEAKLMAEQFRLRQESLAVLTPEQRTQLEQRRQERKQRREQRRERRRGEPRGEGEMF
ncbi:MAG TPA: periplasmic heavy metal sensor [Pyrinomonadaceae bacterium]|nr:periplasmic heavy metal sensor [Pyrinomonadaceae bacterium]